MYKVISIKEYFILNDILKEELLEDIFYSKKIHDEQINSMGVKTNFKVVRDRNSICKTLYKKFLETSKSIFGDIALDSTNSDSCYSLCTNKNYWESVPHDHIETSTINSVFYLQVPKINGSYCGKIFFLNGNMWEGYQPEPFEMLIMPNYLIHNTEYHDTEEWRVSLNFEITCKNEIDWKILEQ